MDKSERSIYLFQKRSKQLKLIIWYSIVIWEPDKDLPNHHRHSQMHIRMVYTCKTLQAMLFSETARSMR